MRLAFPGELAEELINEDFLHHDHFFSESFSAPHFLHIDPHNLAAKYSVVSVIGGGNDL